MKRFHKTAAALLCGALALSLCMPLSLAANNSFENFKTVAVYQNNFSDVSGWYRDAVAAAYELGLVSGKSAASFAPDANMTVGEAVKLAACLHSIYATGSADFSTATPWYRVYADYCLQNDILAADYGDYSAAITRGQFAALFAAVLPESALPVMNNIADGAIPDVSAGMAYSGAVYTLYRAGILTGSDSAGTFYPATTIRRSEMAAIVTRMADPTLRRRFSLSAPDVSDSLTAVQIFAKCAPSVFYITTYDAKGKAQANGSGVFLSADGLGVTNWHVMDGASSATIKTSAGRSYTVSGICDYSIKSDVAYLRINGNGFTPMSVNTSALPTGTTVYSIGSPLGLENSLSQGIVSNAGRMVDGISYIQTTAAISSGSSGGALINGKGELVGLTTATYAGGQNLNLALPAAAFSQLSGSSSRSVSVVTAEAHKKIAAAFTVSATTAKVKPDGTASISCSAPLMPNDYVLSYSMSISGVISCMWSEWDGDNVTLYIQGIKAGSCVVSLQLLDGAKNPVASKSVTVTVTDENGNVTSVSSYYPNAYPVPDYSVFSGISLSTKTVLSEGGTEYYYNTANAPEGTTSMYLVAEYASLLVQNGFTYAGSFERNGDTFLSYTNDNYGWKVSYGMIDQSSSTYICVRVEPLE